MSNTNKNISLLKAQLLQLKIENKNLKKQYRVADGESTVKVPKEIRPIFDKAEKTVGKYFESLRLTPSKGTIQINDERYILVRASAMSLEFLNSISHYYSDRGTEEAMNIGKNILFDLAHMLGLEDAHNFHKKMKLKDPISKLSAGPVHFAYSGWAFVDILPGSRPSPDENYYIKYNHPYSFEADSWIKARKKSKTPVCIMNSGYSSGWCEASYGVALTAVEITCRAKGDKNCTFIMAPPHKIDSYLGKSKRKILQSPISVPTFLERKKIEEELKFSEKHYREIFDNASDMIQSIDLNGKIIYVNEAWRKTLGYTKSECIGKNITEFIHPEYINHCMMMMNAMAEGLMERVDKMEIFFITKNKMRVLVEGNVNIKKEKGELIGTTGIFRNITEKKLASEKIKQSLKEKEVLLKEIHHRVKNNLQIISSLLNLQADKIENATAKEKYIESIGRIKSMAIIHELLYKSKNLSTLKITEYITELINYISQTYDVESKIKVSLKINVASEFIDINRAIPFGIMINELLSNAFKYAFPGNKQGEIIVEFDDTINGKHHYSLKVSDNGIGLSKKINQSSPETLGLQLINSLVEQLDGKIKINSESGTSFFISFPATK